MRTSEQMADRCNADGEFRMAARYWNGGLRFEIGDVVAAITIENGMASPIDPGEADGVLTLAAPQETWTQMLAAVPPRFANDIAPARALGLHRRGNELLYWQYAPAVQRAVEVLRDEAEPGHERAEAPKRRPDAGPFDAPVGRYVHLDLDGEDHRIYFEEAGSGIPVLLQHTAGAHGTQWRHLMECTDLTDHFRLIAYDLPFHGKSVPPTGQPWWEMPYRLDGDFLRSIPLGLADVLGLDRPVFMGCSVGGLLALDLAHKHADRFRAVVSVEGALHIGGDHDPENLLGFWHPQVSNETKARMMEGLTSPTSPKALRKETIQTYASGWPPAFYGDLHYYMVDYDLRADADAIDTNNVGVHILSGEYDYSGTVEKGRDAHQTIAGSTFTEMKGVGHFPMSENPDAFLEHLLPIMGKIRG